MKWLLVFLERCRPLFHEDGSRFRALKPLYEAIEVFFFAPLLPTRHAPYVRDPLDLKRYMSMVIVGLAPCVVASLYFFGLRVLAMILVSYTVGGIVEVLFSIVRKHEVNEGFLVTGLIFPLVLPPATPLWMVGVGITFGVVVGKEVFGGTGRNLFNPAMLGRCFLSLGYPAAMAAGCWVRPGAGMLGRLLTYDVSDAITSATPLALAKQGTFESAWRLFAGAVPGSAGETCAAAAIVGGVFLLLTRVGNWRNVAGTLLSYFILGSVLRTAFPAQFGPVGWHMLAGGFLFGTFFMVTDPVTAPATNAGRWLYGGLVGTLTLLIRNLTGYVEGMMFAVLLGNIAAPLLDELVLRQRVRRYRNAR